MSEEIIKCQVLPDKSAELIKKIIDSDSDTDSRSCRSVNLTSQKLPEIFIQGEESILHQNDITWDLSLSHVDKKGCIESPRVEVNILDICTLWLEIKECSDCNRDSIDLYLHFRSLPKNVRVLWEITFLDIFKNVLIKKSLSKNSCDLKEDKFEFCMIDNGTYVSIVSIKEFIIKCRIKLLSQIYNCKSKNLTYSVCRTPEVNNIYEDILENGKYSDIILGVESETLNAAHQFLLAISSPSLHILLKMNYDNIQELTNEKLSTIRQVLEFIYTGNFQIFNYYHATKLYIAAYKYELLNLKDICSAYLITSLTEKNISYVFDLARYYEDSYLFDACIEFMKTCDIEAKTFLGRTNIFLKEDLDS